MTSDCKEEKLSGSLFSPPIHKRKQKHAALMCWPVSFNRKSPKPIIAFLWNTGDWLKWRSESGVPAKLQSVIWWPLAVWLLIPENTSATRPDHIKLRQGRVIILAWQGSAPEGQMARVRDRRLYHRLKVRIVQGCNQECHSTLSSSCIQFAHMNTYMRPELDWGQLYIF